jgi:hypothetical protein
VGLDGIKDGTSVGDSMGMDEDGASVGDSVKCSLSTSPSCTLKDVALATKSLGKEHLGGRSGLHFLVIMSHSPEQQGVALFEYIELMSIKN